MTPDASPTRPARAGAEHELLEHPGELRLRVRAPSLAELLAEAGRALAGITLDERGSDGQGRWYDVEVRSSDRDALLVDWLNELVFLAETRSEVPTEFDVRDATDQAVMARVRGVRVAEPPSLVKAATLHGARIHETARGLEANVVLDI